MYWIFLKKQTSLVEYDDCVNLLKGAIECSNWVSTVSPTYAQEIMDPWFSYKLDGILKERSWKLSGILNGIDTKNYNPENRFGYLCSLQCCTP